MNRGAVDGPSGAPRQTPEGSINVNLETPSQSTSRNLLDIVNFPARTGSL